jgi:hypothetical protein
VIKPVAGELIPLAVTAVTLASPFGSEVGNVTLN